MMDFFLFLHKFEASFFIHIITLNYFKMKKIQLFFVLSSFFVSMSVENVYSSTIVTESELLTDTTLSEISKGYSHVGWVGYKIGGKHNGKIEVSKGQLRFVDGTILDGTFELDITTLSNEDLKDEGANSKLVTHLKSADFFNAEKFPKATFKIEKAIKYGLVGENKTKYKIKGPLTIKGITKTISFEADVFEYETSYSISGILKIDRSDFDIRYGSGTFFGDIGDKVIYDDVKLNISLVALK